MKYFEEKEGVPAEVYYHYTSLEALYNIVTSKTFRLTNLKSSNDKKELFYSPEQFLADLEKVCNEEKHENIKKYLLLVKESIEQNYNVFLTACKEKRFPYALCLSEKKDNLIHWDRYALSSTGVCIGFNVSALAIYLKRKATTAFGIGLYDVGDVIYSADDREKYIREGLIHFFEFLYEQECKKGVQISVKELIHNNAYLYATNICLKLTKFSKKDSFVDEDEVRLYHDTASIKSTLNLIDLMESTLGNELYHSEKRKFLEVAKNLQLDDEKFCMTKRGIRGYKNLCLEEVWGSGTIPEIILGPMCVQNCNELRRFLKANGLEGTKVTVSKISMR